MRSLLTAISEGDEAQSALAAKALASVVGGTPALQEVLLDAGGEDVLVRHLDAPKTPQADERQSEDRFPHAFLMLCICAASIAAAWYAIT